MFTVKKVHKGEYVYQIAKANRVTVFATTAKGWAVVDEKGIPICHMNETTGKPIFEVFSQKGIAQKQADWMGRNIDKIELLEVKKM